MLETLTAHFFDIFTPAGAFALLNIIIIDIVMSGDNAIVIGMATAKLPEKLRKKAIMIGIVAATALRIIFAIFVTVLLAIPGLRFIGGLLLLYVVWKFYRDLTRKEEATHKEIHIKASAGYMAAIWTIVIADVSMSLDNVLAVAGAAQDNLVTLGIGLVVSILLMAFAANYIAKKLDKYPWVQWIGLLVIVYVAGHMLYEGYPEVYDLAMKLFS